MRVEREKSDGRSSLIETKNYHLLKGEGRQLLIFFIG